MNKRSDHTKKLLIAALVLLLSLTSCGSGSGSADETVTPTQPTSSITMTDADTGKPDGTEYHSVLESIIYVPDERGMAPSHMPMKQLYYSDEYDQQFEAYSLYSLPGYIIKTPFDCESAAQAASSLVGQTLTCGSNREYYSATDASYRIILNMSEISGYFRLELLPDSDALRQLSDSCKNYSFSKNYDTLKSNAKKAAAAFFSVTGALYLKSAAPVSITMTAQDKADISLTHKLTLTAYRFVFAQDESHDIEMTGTDRETGVVSVTILPDGSLYSVENSIVLTDATNNGAVTSTEHTVKMSVAEYISVRTPLENSQKVTVNSFSYGLNSELKPFAVVTYTLYRSDGSESNLSATVLL